MPNFTENAAVEAILDLFLKLRHEKDNLSASEREDYRSRTIICTPYGGNYTPIAGWVVCVEGSPPKGTLVIDLFWIKCVPSQIAYIGIDGCRKIRGQSQVAIVKAFVESLLKDANGVVTIPGRKKGGK